MNSEERRDRHIDIKKKQQNQKEYLVGKYITLCHIYGRDIISKGPRRKRHHCGRITWGLVKSKDSEEKELLTEEIL